MTMQQGVRIAVIGESVLMEGIIINLEDDPSIEVARAGVEPEAALELVVNFRPHVMVYELGFPDMEEVLSHASLSTFVRLVVLDDNCNQALVMDSRLIRMPSMADLLQLIMYPLLEHPEEAARVEDSARTPGLDTLPV
jgi:hypothetical protein